MPEPVPTVAELALRGMADPVAFNSSGQPTHWRLTPGGQQLVYEAMQRRADAARAARRGLSAAEPLGESPPA